MMMVMMVMMAMMVMRNNHLVKHTVIMTHSELVNFT